MKEKTTPPIVSIIGNSGSGKTTFIERLIPEIKRRGLKVGTIKHDVHGFEMDKPGKDTWRHKQAGASVTVISSPYQVGVVIDVDHDHRPEELLPFLTGMDLILTEGYKRGDKPKLEIFRSAISKEPLCKNDKNLLALVSDEEIDIGVPRFSSKEIDKVTDLLITYFNLAPTQKAK